MMVLSTRFMNHSSSKFSILPYLNKESRCSEFNGMVTTVLHSGLSGIFCWVGIVTNTLVSDVLDPFSTISEAVIGVVNQTTSRSYKNGCLSEIQKLD